MPSIAAHMICAKIVANKVNIKDKEFIKGNLLPDIINISNSHKRIKGKHYYIPDIDYFINNLNLDDNLSLGYLTHLLLDKLFLENYIFDQVKGEDVFFTGVIYREYDIINYMILSKFNIDINYLNNILKDYNVCINEEKYQKNINSLNLKKIEEELKYLDVVRFSKFLIEASNQIVEILKEVKINECKSNLSNNSIRKRIKS